MFEGLHLAKEAVEMDTTDGQSWLILGNSYLSVAFYSAHNESCIQKALAAYRQAENRQGTSVDSYVNSSDLYYNKATVSDIVFCILFQRPSYYHSGYLFRL